MDFKTIHEGSSVSVSDTSSYSTGNESLSSRFLILMMAPDGGNASKMIGTTSINGDDTLLTGAIIAVIEDTIEAMHRTEGLLPDTEKLEDAYLSSMKVINGVITATIEVVPVERESEADLSLRVPITKRGI